MRWEQAMCPDAPGLYLDHPWGSLDFSAPTFPRILLMASERVSESSQPARGYIRGLRWWICGLLFLATTINYVDRQSLSVLKTMLEREMHWSEADYGWIQFAFTTAYAAFPSIMGRLIDSLGVKFGLAMALIAWSTMSMVTAL